MIVTEAAPLPGPSTEGTAHEKPRTFPTRELVQQPDFDPIALSALMYTTIGGKTPTEAGISWDDWIKRRHAFVSKYVEGQPFSQRLSWGEVSDRLQAVDRAVWTIRETERLGKELHPGVELSEIIQLRPLLEMIAQQEIHRTTLHYAQKDGAVDKKWVPTPMPDALAVASGLMALCARENIPLGKSLVDLGGGDGAAGLIMAQLGFAVTLIERNEYLNAHFQKVCRELQRHGVSVGFIRQLASEFHLDSASNTPEVNEALKTADVLYCYPWPGEVEDRLQLFIQYGKPESLLVLYGGSMDDFLLEVKVVEKLELEVIGISTEEIKTAQKQGGRFFRGFSAAEFGSNWIALRKKPSGIQ